MYMQILTRDGKHTENEKWINVVGDLACCISIKRPKEVELFTEFASLSLSLLAFKNYNCRDIFKQSCTYLSLLLLHYKNCIHYEPSLQTSNTPTT